MSFNDNRPRPCNFKGRGVNGFRFQNNGGLSSYFTYFLGPTQMCKVINLNKCTHILEQRVNFNHEISTLRIKEICKFRHVCTNVHVLICAAYKCYNVVPYGNVS